VKLETPQPVVPPAPSAAPAPAEPSSIELVAGAWATALDVPRERIGAGDHFFELGGNSLSALRVVVELDGLVTLADLTRDLPLDQLARLVADREEEEDIVLHALSDPPNATCALVCVPYPSGHPINFRPLAQALAGLTDEIAVSGVELGGHDDSDEADVRRTAAILADEIAATVATPVMVWGHCGGAAVAIELAGLLEDRGFDVRHVFIGSKLLPVAQDMRESIELVESMSDEEIIRFMVDETGYGEMDGLDREHADRIAREFRRHVLAGYRYLVEASEQPERPLAAPFTCVVSAGDRQVAGYEVAYERWSLLAPQLRLHVVGGADHYFARTRALETARLIHETWAAATPAALGAGSA
jgi:surfactin synthase thioesterase subunit